MYPALQQFDDKRDWVGEAMREHQQVEQTLKMMAAKSPEQQDFQSHLQELMQEVQHHVGEEENDIFPKLQQRCDPQQLQEMGRQMMQMKQGQVRSASPGSMPQQLH